MENSQLFSDINTLPSDLKKQVQDFVAYLKSKNQSETNIKERKFGCAKGLFEMHEDFDEPLDDFKDYM